MLRPMLFVGCGGSGLRTLRRLRRELGYQLSTLGFDESEFPAAWQFLAVDVPASEQIDPGLANYAYNSYLGLAPSMVSYRFPNGLDDQLNSRVSTQTDYCQWRPNPDRVLVDLTYGAGQYRAVGRVAGVFSIASVTERLEKAVSDLCAEGVRHQLNEIGSRIGIEASGADPDPMVFMVTSLGGGAGSGIFMDVCDALRRLRNDTNHWTKKIFGILYDPTIFYTQDGIQLSGISPNSLGALNELVAGRWNPSKDWSYIGGTGNGGSNRGPEYSFIFGLRNGNIELEKGDDAYQIVASILANLTLSGGTGSSFVDSVVGNWQANSQKAIDAPRIHEFAATNSNRPISSLGYARVTLGRDRFARYAAERLTRSAIERILTLHITDDVREGTVTADESVTRLVRRDLPDGGLVRNFLNECGLNEGSLENNQIIDALLNQDDMKSTIAEVQTRVLSKITHSEAIIGQLGDAVADDAEIRQSGGRAEVPLIRTRIVQQAVGWSQAIEAKVLDVTSRWIVEQGVLVTARVLQHVIEDIGTTFPNELRAEAASDTKAGEDAGASITQLIEKTRLKKGVIPEPIKKALREYIRIRMTGLADRDVREVAAPLLEDMASNFLKPILKALEESRALLSADFGSADFKRLSSDSVSAALQPPANEKAMLDIAQFPATYLDLMARASGGRIEAEKRAFVAEPSEGSRSSSLPESVQPWSVPPGLSWIPDFTRVGGGSTVKGQPLSVAFRLSLPEILNRCTTWLQYDKSSSTGLFLNQTLGEYLNEGSLAQQTSRAKELADLLGAAFDLAKPFVQLNGTWLQGESQYLAASNNFTVSPIPMAAPGQGQAGSPSYQKIEAVMVKHVSNVGPGDFDKDAQGDIEIYSWLNPLTPAGISSLAEPIVTHYRAQRAQANKVQADGFWTFRRARPLAEAIPLTRAAQLTLTRGWLTALALDVVDIENNGQSLRCTFTEGGSTYQLLSPPLGLPEKSWDWFGMALESALLAEMLAATGDTAAFDALEALLRLGSTDGSGMVTAMYSAPNPALVGVPLPGLERLAGEGEPSDLSSVMCGIADDCENMRVEPSATWAPVRYLVQLAPLVAEAARQIHLVADQASGDGRTADKDSHFRWE